MRMWVLCLMVGMAWSSGGCRTTPPSHSAASAQPDHIGRYRVRFEDDMPKPELEAAVRIALATPEVTALPKDRTINIYKRGEDQLSVHATDWGTGYAVLLSKSGATRHVVKVSRIVE